LKVLKGALSLVTAARNRRLAGFATYLFCFFCALYAYFVTTGWTGTNRRLQTPASQIWRVKTGQGLRNSSAKQQLFYEILQRS